MAKIKNETRIIFEAEGLLNSDSLENINLETDEDGIIDYASLLTNANGKRVKVQLITIEENDLPLVDEEE